MTDCPEPDFHVISLRFLLQSNERVTYVNPPPLEFETENIRFRLADGKLTCEMKTHFSTEKEARLVVDPILKAWEADAELPWNRAGELQFKFEGAEIIDRSPAPRGVVRGHAHITLPPLRVNGVGMVSAHAQRDRYPEPPIDFRLNADVESMVHRYMNYLRGREPLPAMAYFCLTVLEAKSGNRKGRRGHVAKTYQVEEAILEKMGELTSNCGDLLTARKAPARRPLSGSEGAWLEAAVKTLICRLGDTRKTGLPLITMSDLPSL